MQFVLMRIRDEEQRDAAAITEVIQKAFANAEHSSGTEAQIVEELRRGQALSVSLVATENDTVIGHIAVSPVTVANGKGWYGLGPVAVRPERQQQGVGSLLIKAALGRLKQRGASGCVVVGDPKFYGKFGFVHDPQLSYADVPAPYFQVLSFGFEKPSGSVTYHSAFEA